MPCSSTRCRKPTSPPKRCSRTCRPDRTSSTASGSRTWPRPTVFGEPQVGRFRTAPRERRSVSFVVVGRYLRTGLGHRRGARRHARLRRPCCATGRTSSSIAATASMPTARSQRELKLPNGEIWRNLVTEEKSKVAETLAEFRGNYKYNLLDRNLRASTPRCRSLRTGTTTRSSTTGGPARRSRRASIATRSALLLAARGRPRLSRIHADAGVAGRGRAHLSPIPYGPLLDVFLLDMRSYRGPNDGRERCRARSARAGASSPGSSASWRARRRPGR